MNCFLYHKYGIPVFGNIFVYCIFLCWYNLSKFLSINVQFCGPIGCILTASILAPAFVFMGNHCFLKTLIVFPESRQMFGHEFITLKRNCCTVGFPTPFGIIIKSWTLKKLFFITGFAAPVIKLNNVVWNVIAYTVVVVMIN